MQTDFIKMKITSLENNLFLKVYSFKKNSDLFFLIITIAVLKQLPRRI